MKWIKLGILLLIPLFLAGWTTMDSWLGTGIHPVRKVNIPSTRAPRTGLIAEFAQGDWELVDGKVATWHDNINGYDLYEINASKRPTIGPNSGAEFGDNQQILVPYQILQQLTIPGSTSIPIFQMVIRGNLISGMTLNWGSIISINTTHDGRTSILGNMSGSETQFRFYGDTQNDWKIPISTTTPKLAGFGIKNNDGAYLFNYSTKNVRTSDKYYMFTMIGTTPFIIGQVYGQTYDLNMEITDIWFYDHILTDSEITAFRTAYN